MDFFNIAKNKEYETPRGVRITWGLPASGLDNGIVTERRTYIYCPYDAAGVLTVDGVERLVEPSSVTVLRPGAAAKLKITRHADVPVVYQVADTAPLLTENQEAALQCPYTLKRSEWNSAIRESIDGKCTEYTDNSRIIVPFIAAKGALQRSNWFTHAFKDQPLSIAETRRQGHVRMEEVEHYHQVTEEHYIINEGDFTMLVEGESRPLPFGWLAVTRLGEAHKVLETTPAASGYSCHLTSQYPGITMDKGERVIVENKAGFDPSALLSGR